MQMAVTLSARSTCTRISSSGAVMQVGAVITSADYRYVFGAGFNGNASGLSNACDSDEPGACGCIHAEANAIVNCRASRSESKIVFCTHLPCKACAKLLINLGGVQAVYYAKDYRLRDACTLFSRVGIAYERVPGDFSQQLHDQVTSLQARCTELLLENRTLRGVDSEGSGGKS